MPEDKSVKKKVKHKILLAVFCAIFAVSLSYIIYYFVGYIQQRSLENKQKDWVSTLPPISQTAEPTAAPLPENEDITASPEDTPSPTPQPRPDYKSRFQSILDINPDFYGLLTIPGLGSNIDDSFVVQGDDNEYYLNRTFDHKRNDRGTLFLDHEASPWFEGRNYVIYGHNMNDGSMFRDILKYDNIDNYAKAPFIEFDTIYGPTVWVVFAAYTCEADFNYFHTYYSDGMFEELLEEIHMRSNFHTDVEVLPTDTLLTLSTCNYTFQDARFAVHARLLREGESLDDFTLLAEKNEKRKPYNVPLLKQLSEIAANQTAFTQYDKRYYFFMPDEAGIEWYVGTDTTSAQGPYSAWNGKINKDYYSWLAAGSVRKNGTTNCYIVSGGINGNKPGLYVLHRNSSPGGQYSMNNRASITPEDVDARWPMLYTDKDQNVTVYYTITQGSSTAFYSVPIYGGTPAYVYKTNLNLDARPMGILDTDNGKVLIIQEFETGAVKAVYLDENGRGDEAVTVDISKREGRYTVYYDLRLNRYRYFSEAKGKLTAGDFDIDLIPAKPIPIAVTPPPPTADDEDDEIPG